MLPFGEGLRPSRAGWARDPRRLVDHAGGDAAGGFDWRDAAGIDRQHVPVRRRASSQHRAGQDILVAGDITDRITANTADNLYFNKNAFSTSAANTFGNAPRTLPGVYSPWRNNIDLSVSKNVRTGGGTSATVRLEVLNMFNIVQWAAPASSQFNNSAFGQINNQANNMRMIQFTLRFAF